MKIIELYDVRQYETVKFSFYVNCFLINQCSGTIATITTTKWESTFVILFAKKKLIYKLIFSFFVLFVWGIIQNHFHGRDAIFGEVSRELQSDWTNLLVTK